jgi:hypothetical protein
MPKLIKRHLHNLKIGDVEEPEIYLAFAWNGFSKTEKGTWIVDNCQNLVYNEHIDPNGLGYLYKISGNLTEENYTFFLLKWGSDEN